MNGGQGKDHLVWVFLLMLVMAIAGMFYMHFSSSIEDLEGELAASRERFAEYKEQTEKLLQAKEDGIKQSITQEMQHKIDSSLSSFNGHVIAIEREITEQHLQLQSIKTELLSNSLSKVTELFQSVANAINASSAARSSVEEQKQSAPKEDFSTNYVAAPTNPAISTLAYTISSDCLSSTRYSQGNLYKRELEANERVSTKETWGQMDRHHFD